jgi:hypothetical protein
VPATVTEGTNPSATVTFSLNAAQANDVVVTYSTVNGTAVAGSDFTAASNATITIPAGQTSVSTTIAILNDATFEASESFSVALGAATLNGTPVTVGGPASVTILDNDSPPAGGTNLLVNGSLEMAGVGVNGYGAFQAIPGWTAIAGGGSIELWNAHNGVIATDGTTFAELDYSWQRDGFGQSVQTVAGQAYDLSFDLRSRPGVSTATQGVEIVWNDVVVATAVPGTAWGVFNVALIGTGGQDRLAIREVASQSGDGLGALLDNFRLVANEAPAGLALQSLSGPEGDTLNGSDGPDVFVFEPAYAGRTIGGFTPDEDLLQFSAGDFNGGLVAGEAPVVTIGAAASGDAAQFVFDPAGGALTWDADGAGAADPEAIWTVEGVPQLRPEDFWITSTT